MKADSERLDQLTRQRLARLGQVPVDTSSLQKRLEAALWQRQQRGRLSGLWSARTFSGVAAALIVAAAAAFVIIRGANTPVVAAPVAIAQVHRELITGGDPVVPVSSIQQANQYLRSEWRQAPGLPHVPGATVTSCCQHSLQNRKVACVLLDWRHYRVTMMVGRSRDVVCGAKHETTVRNGKRYAVHQADGLQMVMFENKGRWVCLMSQAPINALMDLADGLQF
jgi:hypothetical protein